MLKTNKILLASAVALAVTACGGSGGGSSSATSSSGIAVDGYLGGSTVTCDADANGVADAGEVNTLTDEQGYFEFSPKCESLILVTHGMNRVDNSTRYPFLGVLSAPANSKFITPVTTLMVESGLSSTEITEKLGLAADIDPLADNPLANLYLYKATLAVQQIIQELADVFGTAPGDTTAYANIAHILAAALASSSDPLFGEDGTVDPAILGDIALEVNTLYGNVITAPNLATLTASIKTQCESLLASLTIGGLELKAVNLQDPEIAPVIATPSQVNYLYLNGDNFKLNSLAIPYASFTSSGGASTSLLNTIGFDFDIAGTPAIDSTVSMALILDEVGGTGRKLEIILSKITFTTNIANQLSVTVPDGSQAFVFARTSDGTEVNLILTNTVADILTINPSTNEVIMDYIETIDVIKNNPQTVGMTAQMDELLALNGTFTTHLLVSGLNIRYANGDAMPIINAAVTGAMTSEGNYVGSITGYGLAGKLVIAP